MIDATNPLHLALVCMLVALGFIVFVLLFQFADWLSKKIP